MSRFIHEANRLQGALLPETIDKYVSEENQRERGDETRGELSHSLDPSGHQHQ